MRRVGGRVKFTFALTTTLLLGAMVAPVWAQAAAASEDDNPRRDAPPASTGMSATSTFRGAFEASFRLLLLEHGGRILFQQKTRRELGGPFFSEYAKSVKVPRTWGDGDGWFVNYIGHPIHGAAAGRTWLLHHPDSDESFGSSGAYWASRALAAQWAAFYSLQFEFGPLSEASIGNVGLRANTTGWVDHVITPVGAFALILGEDALDQYVVQLIERHTASRVLRATVRILLNPSRALANVADGRTPWYRRRGPLHLRY